MEKRRVLYLTNIPSPYRVEFFNELSKYTELTVAFELEKAKNRDITWKTDETYNFRAVFMKSKFAKTESAYCPEVFRLLKEYRNDIIVVGGYSTPTGMAAIIYLRLNKISFYLNCDGGFVGRDSFIKRKLKNFFIKSASGYLSTGKGADEYLVHYGAESGRIFHYSFSSVREDDIIKVPIDYEEKIRIREGLGIKENKMLLFVGSFIHRKGIDILIKATKDFEDTAIVLVGGNELGDYGKVAQGVKADFYTVGFKSKEELKKYYKASDIFIFPTREDIWGLVINEAMATGLPVITTDRCLAGLELVKNGKNGYIVCAEDVDSLRAAVKKLIENYSAEYSKNSLNAVKNYTIENMAIEHRDIFEKRR